MVTNTQVKGFKTQNKAESKAYEMSKRCPDEQIYVVCWEDWDNEIFMFDAIYSGQYNGNVEEILLTYINGVAYN